MSKAKVIDRRFLLIQERIELCKKHGDVKGGELFKEKYGQKGIDDCFNYMISCATVKNYRAAEAMGHEMGTYIIPENLERS